MTGQQIKQENVLILYKVGYDFGERIAPSEKNCARTCLAHFITALVALYHMQQFNIGGATCSRSICFASGGLLTATLLCNCVHDNFYCMIDV